MKKKLLLFIIIALLYNSANCFAADTQTAQNTEYHYTKQELQQGREKAQRVWFALDLQYVKVGNNCLKAGAVNWTEQSQVLFIQTTGIKNVSFETVLPEENKNPIPVQYNFYIAQTQKDNSVLVKYKWGFSDYKPEYDTIYFEQKPYLKNNNIMIPLKEMFDIENKNRALSEKTAYTLQPEQCSIQCGENKILFYKNKRDVIVNDVKLGLYEVPDITQHDIFISAKDLKMILEDSAPNTTIVNKEGRQTVNWNFGILPEKNKNIVIHHTPPERTNITAYIVDDNSISFGDEYMVYTIPSYNKNNHIMIAIEDLKYMDKSKINFNTDYDSQNNTLSLKMWYTIAKDVLFTKNSNKMIVDGIEIEMSEIAEIKNDQFYIPITALFDILEIPKQNIVYSQQNKTITATY